MGGKGGVDWERAQSGMAKVVGEDDSEARETQEAFVDALFSFGGGIGGECFGEPAANLKTLREAKREDDEVDCFCPDPELLVVAIEDGRGRPDVPTEVSGGGRVLHGKVLVPSDGLWLRIRANTHKSRFGFVWTLWRDIKSFPRQQTETERGTLEGTWSCFQHGVLAKMSIPLLLRSTLPPLFLFLLLLFRSAAILGTPWCLLLPFEFATRPFHGSLGRRSFFRCQKKKKVEYFKSVAGATHGDIIHLLYHRNYRPWHGLPNLTQGYLRPVSYLQFVELHFSPCHRFPNLTSQRLVGQSLHPPSKRRPGRPSCRAQSGFRGSRDR